MYKLNQEAVDKQITIEGEFVSHYTSIIIEQYLYKHHSFEVTIDLETIESEGSHTLELSKQWLGKQLTTNISGKAFVGVVLDVSLVHDQVGLHGQIVLKGLSQTVLLENGKQQKSWLNKDLSAIVSEIIQTTDVKHTVAPIYTSPIPYSCQYGESNYSYLQRLAHHYNEWFYFNGMELIFGKPRSNEQEPIELEYSKDLKDIQIKVQTFQPTLGTYSYNALADENYQGEVQANANGLNSLGSTALEASKNVYGASKDFSVSELFLQDKSSLDSYLEKRLQGVTATGNVLQATGERKGLRLGSVIKVTARTENKEGEEEIQQYGEYIIVQINHYATPGVDYHNTFTAIPSSVQGLPVNDTVHPICTGNQLATVVSNQDPDNKGRVQVQFSWQQPNNDMTDFIRVMTNDAGSSELTETNRGFVFIPEEGDQVMVGFEYDDPNRPFVLGSMFTGVTGAGGSEANVKKSIITRSGHTIELDDTDDAQKITIKDNGGSIIEFDTNAKSLYIQATENIEFEAKNIRLKASENVEIQTEQETKIAAEADVSILSQANIAVQAEQDATVTSGSNTTIEATGDATVTGQSMTVEGQTNTTVKGQQTKVEGQMTTVQGASGKFDVM